MAESKRHPARPAAFGPAGRSFRGNLHCHSNRSDGGLEPDRVIGAYKDLGYDFICLSDHFERSYGWPITDTSPWRDASFTTLIGAELTNPIPFPSRGCYAFVAVGLPFDFAPVAAGETGPELAARAQRAGAFTALCHPGYMATRVGDIEGLAEALDAVEVYNDGVQRANGRGDGWYLCEELLDRGFELASIASDDAHFQFNAYNALGGAWVQVRAESLDPEALLKALKAGAFYSTTGPLIDDVFVEDREVTVRCSPASTVSLTGPSWLQRHVADLTWDGTPSEPGGFFGAIEERRTDGITRCRFSLADPGPSQGGDTEGEWLAGDWWRVTVTDAAGRRAWTNATRLQG